MLAALRRIDPPPWVPAVSEDAVAVAQALRTLSVGQRQVVVLHYLVGLRVEEVARELAVPVGTVKSRLTRARRMLAHRLGEQAQEVPSNNA
jgi:RNA polymerase sigma-70 factor (ECF subfamily)